MYLKTVGWIICISWLNLSHGYFRHIVKEFIKRYKETTLPFREDEYQNNLPILDSYDFVIVGAGPSGCAIANRLSENPDISVLLLEAGPETFFIHDVPLMHLLIFETEYNWKYNSAYNPGVCRSMNHKTCPWPSGKGVGGGTVINALIYTRGNKRDYDEWAEMGNSGWSYNDVLPYFKKLENVKDPILLNKFYRGENGPVYVSYAPYRPNASLAFIDAGNELGYPTMDYNLPYKSGFAKIQLTLKDGARWGAADAYLKPISKRKNLHLVQRAFVTKILIDQITKTSFGVEFYKKGVKRKVRANKEIILSAGAFGSPKLLMLSGIGPNDHLESLGIQTIQDLRVGDNLQEHVGATFLPFLTDNSSSFLFDYDPLFAYLPIHFFNYQITREGPGSSTGVDSIAYVSSRYSNDYYPDIELLFVGLTYATDYGHTFRKSVGIRDDIYNSYYKALENETGFSIWVMGCYPKSRGRVRLSSKNPFIDPIIENNFFEHKEDLDVVVDGIKKAIQLTKTKAFKRHNVRLYNKNHPGCENIHFGTDEYWECTVRQITAQYHHQCGTCKMGPEGDPTAVVDSRLRVYGIKKLRVADASIMPKIPGGHTVAPAYMIGEKAADMIKQDNSLL